LRANLRRGIDDLTQHDCRLGGGAGLALVAKLRRKLANSEKVPAEDFVLGSPSFNSQDSGTS